MPDFKSSLTLNGTEVSLAGHTHPDVDTVPKGTAFPGSPASGDVYFRTDLGMWCYYDGTRWLSSQRYTDSFPFVQNISVNTDVVADMTPAETVHKPYLLRWDVICTVRATNSASNYWRIGLYRAGGTSVVSVNTSLIAANATYQSVSSTSGFSQPYASPTLWYPYAVKVGTPTGLDFWAKVTYQLVIT